MRMIEWLMSSLSLKSKTRCFRTAAVRKIKAHPLNLKKITQGRLKLTKKGKDFAILFTFFPHKWRILKIAAAEVL